MYFGDQFDQLRNQLSLARRSTQSTQNSTRIFQPFQTFAFDCQNLPMLASDDENVVDDHFNRLRNHFARVTPRTRLT